MKPIIKKELYNELVIYSVLDENKVVKKNSTFIEIYTRVEDFDTSDYKKALDFVHHAQYLFMTGNETKDLSQKELYILNSKDYNPDYKNQFEYTYVENYFKITVGASTFKKSVIKKEILFSNIFEKLLMLLEKGYMSEDSLSATRKFLESNFEQSKDKPMYHIYNTFYEKADDLLSKVLYGTALKGDYSFLNNENIELFCNKILKILLNPIDAFGFAYVISDDSDYIDDAIKTVKETFKDVKFIKPVALYNDSAYFTKGNEIFEIDTISNSTLTTRLNFENKIDRSPTIGFINGIYGVGLGSWLFTEIREKLEAGYSTVGLVSNNNRFIYTLSDILNEKYEVVLQKLNELNKDLIAGKFDKDMLESLKSAKIINIDRAFDNEYALRDMLINMYWFNVNTIDEFKELHNKVTVEDLVKITSTLKPEMNSCFIKGTKNE